MLTEREIREEERDRVAVFVVTYVATARHCHPEDEDDLRRWEDKFMRALRAYWKALDDERKEKTSSN